MPEIFATKLGRSLACVISFDLSTTRNKSVPKHAVNNISEKKKRECVIVLFMGDDIVKLLRDNR